MKKMPGLFFLLLVQAALGQEISPDSLVAESSDKACLCIDSIHADSKSAQQISLEVNNCLKKLVVPYQLSCKLAGLPLSDNSEKKHKKNKKQKLTIELSNDPGSAEFQKYYFELERSTMQNCPALKNIINVEDTNGPNSFSKNPESVRLYRAGVADWDAGRIEDAIDNYKAALAIDSLFSFAWDNLGRCFRKLNRYQEAVAAYQKSIAINPEGKVPLQNLAVAYEYLKDYERAIETYQLLAQLDNKNPEVYYGIGRICTYNMHQLEKGLDNMCTAYNLYIEQRSPYRTDAEKVINYLYDEMKKEGNENRFNEILKQHHISIN